MITARVLKALSDGWLVVNAKMTNEGESRTMEEETFIHKDAVIVHFGVLRGDGK